MTIEDLKEDLKAQVAGLTEAQAAAVLRAIPLSDKIRLLPDADIKAILAQLPTQPHGQRKAPCGPPQATGGDTERDV